MRTINATTIGEAHEKVVHIIMSEDFNDVVTEDKEWTFEHPEPINIHIQYPLKEPHHSEALQFGERSLTEYTKQILTPRRLIDTSGKPDFSYLYSNLLFDYPCGGVRLVLSESEKINRADWDFGNGRGDGINQISIIVQKLLKNPTSRRAVAVLYNPYGHPIMDDPPCLNHVQFLIRNGELNCHALFRSNDMLSAWGGNAYALMHLQKYVLDEINGHTWEPGTDLIGMGFLETTSISAHIYWKRDHHELEQFKKRWQ